MKHNSQLIIYFIPFIIIIFSVAFLIGRELIASHHQTNEQTTQHSAVVVDKRTDIDEDVVFIPNGSGGIMPVTYNTDKYIVGLHISDMKRTLETEVNKKLYETLQKDDEIHVAFSAKGHVQVIE